MRKIYINANEQFDEDINKLKDLNPGFDTSTLIRLAIRSAALNEYKVILASEDRLVTENIKKRRKSEPKEAWCAEYGGIAKDGVCTIDKYEILPTGHVRKSPRTIAFTAFPIDRDDFRKDIMGKYMTIEEAEAAYKAKSIS